jgi:hypothetical protein
MAITSPPLNRMEYCKITPQIVRKVTFKKVRKNPNGTSPLGFLSLLAALQLLQMLPASTP